MSGINHFETFLLAGILLNLTPGNDTIFILTKSIAQGRRAGVLSAMGIATGSIIHTLFAAFGLSIIIAKSLLLFDLVKYAGAGYLIYIGIKTLLDKSKLDFTQGDPQATKNAAVKTYRDAVVTNVLNPKVAMFFIAFLPQFIDPSAKTHVLPFLTLGLTFTTTGTIWCVILAIFSAQIFSKLRSHDKFSVYLNKTCGTVLVGLGIKLAFTNRE
ncbi:MAG TPA: LysE family translocator [bacterium]